ncbi:hypothetical protein [Acidithiobacillus sulfuriphilus]|uniref:hypothetical protein n=1 Tax=Acidithiobacillus sulfuriphilus TaxID=1867749 RepID=UPI003F5FE27F
MSKATFLRIVIGVIGLLFVMLTFWLGKFFNLGVSTKMVVVLSFALATFFAEVIIAIDNLDKSIKRVFPLLELPTKDQASLIDTINLYNKLKEKRNSIPTSIALAEFDNIHRILLQANNGGDFIFHDIYSSSMILLEALRPGQSFKVVSNLSKKFYWKSGKQMTEHAMLNFKQAKNGVRIERIFVFNNENELQEMKEVMMEQRDNGIEVCYAFKDDLFGVLHYASFAISEELNTGIISHRDDLLGKVTVTSNSEMVTTLSGVFDTIKSQAIR